jgi:hypothetical protein
MITNRRTSCGLPYVPHNKLYSNKTISFCLPIPMLIIMKLGLFVHTPLFYLLFIDLFQMNRLKIYSRPIQRLYVK